MHSWDALENKLAIGRLVMLSCAVVCSILLQHLTLDQAFRFVSLLSARLSSALTFGQGKVDPTAVRTYVLA